MPQVPAGLQEAELLENEPRLLPEMREANFDTFLCTSVLPQSGQITSAIAVGLEDSSSSSNGWPQVSQTNSYSGIESPGKQ
jgi:hypothetical protein